MCSSDLIDQLWKMLSSPPKSSGLTTSQVEGGADYWIMWRRVAGGLGSALQNTLMNRLRPILIPAKGKNTVKPGANELAEMWRAAASLERLDLRTKEALANALIRQTNKSPTPTYVFWALTRIASRSLFYGPLNLVLHPQIVEPMIDTLLAFKAENDSERNGWAFCLANMARLTGQRSLDVDEAVRLRVIETLRTVPTAAKWLPMLEQVIEMEAADRGQLFGESLPKGLRLIG